MLDNWQTEYGQAFCEQRILVTGATGFVGRHLCDALEALGAVVYGLSRTASACRAPAGCVLDAVDVRNYPALRAAVARIRPTVVYHLAGLVDTRRDNALLLPTLEANLLGTVHLLQALTEIGCERAIVMGSSEELCCADGGTPNSPYAAAKAASHLYGSLFCDLYHLPLVTTRLFMAYGPRQSAQKFIPYTITTLLQGHVPQLLSGERVCDLIFIDDLTRGLLAAALAPGAVGQTIDLGTGQGTPLRAVAEQLATITGSACHPIDANGQQGKSAAPQIADTRTHALLDGWRPRWSLRDGLSCTVDWYRRHLAVEETNKAGCRLPPQTALTGDTQ